MGDKIIQAVRMIQEIATESGSLKKKELIESFAAQSEEFQLLLYYALNPMLTYNLSEKTLYAACKEAVIYHSGSHTEEYKLYEDVYSQYNFEDIFEICETLSHRSGITDVMTKCVAYKIILAPHNVRDFYIKLLSKTLRLGVTAKTVNKVIPGLIPEWEVQQAYPIEKYPLKPGTSFYLTQKLNGVRATYYKGRLYARSGKPYSGLDNIIVELNVINDALVQDYIFDGELTLLHHDAPVSDNEAFRIATGIINSDAETKTEIGFTIFDMVPEKDFETGGGDICYFDRRSFMNNIFTYAQGKYVSLLPSLYCGDDQSMIDSFLDKMVEEDKEGLMVNLDVPYKRKRHNGILKVKRFYTVDLRIIRCEEGSGRLEGTLGAIVVEYDGGELHVGSGFTDEQRDWFWSHQSEVVGSIAEVKYKEISSDKNTGRKSLQFPIFVRLRNDKSTVNEEG